MSAFKNLTKDFIDNTINPPRIPERVVELNVVSYKEGHDKYGNEKHGVVLKYTGQNGDADAVGYVNYQPDLTGEMEWKAANARKELVQLYFACIGIAPTSDSSLLDIVGKAFIAKVKYKGDFLNINDIRALPGTSTNSHHIDDTVPF